MSIARLIQPIPLASFPPVAQRLVTGLRMWATANRAGKWPVPVLNDHLGCRRAAAHLQLVIEEIAQAWPEPFCLGPLCCRRASYDEVTLAGMAAAAADRDRPAFDRVCADLLGADARERLFLSISVVAAAIAVPAAAGD